jgi:hypothetical protein
VTRLRKALRWLAPFHALWLVERDAHAATRRALAAAEADLDMEREVHAVTQIDLDAHRRHFAVACSQRDAARDFAAAIVSEREWTDSDRRFLDEGVWPS